MDEWNKKKKEIYICILELEISGPFDSLEKPIGEALQLLSGCLRFALEPRIGVTQSHNFGFKRLTSILFTS